LIDEPGRQQSGLRDQHLGGGEVGLPFAANPHRDFVAGGIAAACETPRFAMRAGCDSNGWRTSNASSFASKVTFGAKRTSQSLLKGTDRY